MLGFADGNAGVAEEFDIGDSERFVGLNGLAVLYFTQWRDGAESGWFKRLWEAHKAIPLVHLRGKAVWFSTSFLAQHLPQLVRATGATAASVQAYAREYLRGLDARFQETVHLLHLRLALWMVRMESDLPRARVEIRDVLNTRISLIRQGLQLATQAGDLFRRSVYMHIYLGVPLQRRTIRAHCQCIEMLKAIRFTFHRRSAMIGESISYMIQQSSFYLQRAFLPLKIRLEQDKKFSPAKIDVLAATSLGASPVPPLCPLPHASSG